MQQHSRKRNTLYSFYLPAIDKEVVLKVSQTSAHYRWYRKLNLFLTNLIKNYSLNAYYGSIALENIGVDSIKSLAYWTCKRQKQSGKTYLLYEKISAPMSAYEFCRQLQNKNVNAEQIIQVIAGKLAATVRKIHQHKLRHGDPHAGNFLIAAPLAFIENLHADKVEKLPFVLIDLDKIQFSDREQPWLRKIRNLRCLRRFRVHDIEGIKGLEYYLGKQPGLMDKAILAFWMRGGFNIYKWIKPRRKRV